MFTGKKRSIALGDAIDCFRTVFGTGYCLGLCWDWLCVKGKVLGKKLGKCAEAMCGEFEDEI